MTATATIRDRYGLAISTTSTAAAEHYVEGVDLLLEQGYGTEQCFQQAIEADEGFALAYAGLSMMQMLRGAAADAKASVAKAQQLVRSATRREQQHVEGVALFTNGQGPKSLAVTLEHLDEFPRDAVMMRVANRLYLLGCSGAGVQNFPEELYAMLQKLEPSYGDDWAFLGQYAFAHHETGRLDEALSLAERSLAARPTSGHASHSVAHVYFEKGNAVDGGDFLGNWLKGYDSRAPFKIHLSWHQALFELAQGKYSDAVKLYEDVIRPTVVEKSANSLMDSTSLMWRLRMYGNCNPPYPIEEISEQASPAANTPGPAFRDAHAALAFAASGDEERLNSVKTRLRDLAGQGDALAKEVTLPLVKGIGAFADDRYEDAARYLEPVFPQLARVGGSHAQREVFEDTLLESYIRAEQYDKAEDLLRERLNRRSSVRDSYWLARTKTNTGDTQTAQNTLKQVAQNWQQADPTSPEIAALNTLVNAG